MSFIEDLAKQALKQPEDSSWGSDLLWDYYGMSGFSQHRDSSVLDRANFAAAQELLEQEFGPENIEPQEDGWFIVHASHWAVGWVEQIMVRILIDKDGGIVEDNITSIFKRCMEVVHHDYPVIDDDIYQEMLEDEIINNISSVIPNWADLEQADPEKIYDVLCKHDIFPHAGSDGESVFFSEEQVFVAIFMLGLYERDSYYVEQMLEDLRIIIDNANTPRSDIRDARDLLIEFMECADNQLSLF